MTTEDMRNTLVRLASAAKPRKSGRAHRENASPLLPPLALYRRIMRAHQQLPLPQRELGNMYVREEFKAHKTTDNPLYIVGFLTSWQDYLHQITDSKWMEGSLTKTQLEKMSPDQVNQLYELMKEAQRVRDGKPLEEDE